MCPTCRYPPCTDCDKARPKRSKYSVEVQEKWTCAQCQLGEKQCAQCHKLKPLDAFGKNAQQRRYAVCKECQHPACATCGQESTDIWTPNPKTPNEVYMCPACQKGEAAKRQCTECLKWLPPSAFAPGNTHGRLHKACNDCLFPTCATCKQKSTKMSHQVTKENNVYVCDDCRTRRICKGRCGRSLPPSAFAKNKSWRMYKVCRECQSAAELEHR